MNIGDTFLPDAPYDHLHMVISEPSLDPAVVLVSFTTWTIDEEDACVADKGDHPFLKHKSAIRYKDARVVTVQQLEQAIQVGKMKSHQPLSAELLKRILDGVNYSNFIPEKCRRILEDQALI